jgi:hypothetical protein
VNIEELKDDLNDLCVKHNISIKDIFAEMLAPETTVYPEKIQGYQNTYRIHSTYTDNAEMTVIFSVKDIIIGQSKIEKI